MAVRSLIQRYEQLAASPSTAPSPADVPPDRPTRGARSVLQLAEIFEPGVSATILARRRRLASEEDAFPTEETAFDARMRVLPGLRLLRLLHRRRRRSGLDWLPQQPEDPHGRRRKRHRIRHGDNWFYRPHVKLSVAPPRPRRLLFELRGANHSEGVQ